MLLGASILATSPIAAVPTAAQAAPGVQAAFGALGIDPLGAYPLAGGGDAVIGGADFVGSIAGTFPAATASSAAAIAASAAISGGFPGLVGSASVAVAAAAQAAAAFPALVGSVTGGVVVAAALVDPASVITYTCLLTGAENGLADLPISIATIQARHRQDADGYGQISIPAGTQYIDGLVARPSGEIVVTVHQGGVSEELLRFAPTYVRLDDGASSQSLTLSGNFAPSTRDALVFDLEDVTYIGTTDGVPRHRAAIRGALRPGDRVRYRGQTTTVSEVSWSVGARFAQMEVST